MLPRQTQYPLSNQVGIDAVAQSDSGQRYAWLEALLNDLGFEGFGIRGSLAHGNPDDKGDGVHVLENIALIAGIG